VEDDRTGPSTEALLARVAVALGTACLLARALPAIVQSFWMDEAGTWWLIDGGWSDLIRRWREWPYQSLAHAALALVARESIAAAEWALRLPSLLAGAATLAIVYRTTWRLLGATAAAAATLALMSSPSFFFAATMARPYAFGLLALAVSCWALERWSATRDDRWLVGWAAGVAIVPHFHSTLLSGVAAQLPLLFVELRAAKPASRRRFTLAAATAVLAGAPLVASWRATAREIDAIDLFSQVRLAFPPEELAPARLVLALLLGVGVAVAGGWWPFVGDRPPARRTLLLAVPLWLVPILTPYALHLARIAPLYVERYRLAGELGLALVAAMAIDRLVPARARVAAVVALAIWVPISPVTRFWPLYDGYDWRSAARASRELVGPDDLVLSPSPFVEAGDARHYPALVPAGRFAAPLAVYRPGGRLVPLPTSPQRDGGAAFARRRLAEERLPSSARVLLIENAGGSWARWFELDNPEFRLVRRTLWGRLEGRLYEMPAGGEPASHRAPAP
jgi:hypothetical protein